MLDDHQDVPHILRFKALVSPSNEESLRRSDSCRSSVGGILCGGGSSVPSAVVPFLHPFVVAIV